jgi:hypothetical protein
MYRSSFASALAMAALAAILLPSALTAQVTFQRTYGGPNNDVGSCAIPATNDGYLIAGTRTSDGGTGDDVYLVRVDMRGETLWTRSFGGAGSDCAKSVRRTTTGGYVVAGSTTSFGAGQADVWLLALDVNGDTLWARTYGGASNDYGESVFETSDGGFVISGETNSFGAEGQNIYLVRTNATGDTLWTRAYGGNRWEEGLSVAQTADSGFIVAGSTDSYGAGSLDTYVVRTDAFGDTLWTRTFGDSMEDYGASVTLTPDGGFVIAGHTMVEQFYDFDVLLLRADAGGDLLWTKTFGRSDIDAGMSVAQTGDSGLLVAGWTEAGGPGGRDVYLIRTRDDGETLWTRTYGGAADDEAYSALGVDDGGFIVAGFTQSFGAGESDVYLIKTDSLGNVAVAEPKASPTRAPGLTIACEPNPATGATTVRLSPFALRYSPLTLRVYDPCPLVPTSCASPPRDNTPAHASSCSARQHKPPAAERFLHSASLWSE